MKMPALPLMLMVLAAIFAPSSWVRGQVLGGPQANFISGGIGDESAARMAAVGREFNLKLLFAAKDGHYLADVAVTISDAGNQKILETVSEGPFLFAQIAPGKYRVTAAYEGVVQTRDTTIAPSGRRELVFRWQEQAESAAAAR